MTDYQWPDTRITRVIDGDTVDALLTQDIKFGGHLTQVMRLRLSRINAAKAKSPTGLLATARVLELTRDQLLHVTTLKPYKYSGPVDYAGEYMAEVVLPDQRNLSDLLVAEGLATYWDGQGPRPADG